MRTLCLVFLGLLSVGCSSVFTETHYFKASDPNTGDPVNYFKVEVTGSGAAVRSRYVSGYYDERAVDLFFNELKTEAATAGDIGPIFNAMTEPGTDVTVKPLSPGPDRGAFIMFFSANAKAAADAIGSFAENQAVADAITNILNRGTIREQRTLAAAAAVSSARNAATLAELEALFAEVPDPTNAVGEEETKAAYLRILSAIARSLGTDVEFGDFDEAVEWAKAQPLTVR
jgi:hypothetical protein